MVNKFINPDPFKFFNNHCIGTFEHPYDLASNNSNRFDLSMCGDNLVFVFGGILFYIGNKEEIMTSQNNHSPQQIIPGKNDIYTFLDCDKRVETDIIPICYFYQWGLVSCEERIKTGNCRKGFRS